MTPQSFFHAELPISGGTAANVAALVVNYNGWQDTLACLRSLQQARLAPAHVVVVDNASSDESWAHLSAFVAGLRAMPAPQAASRDGGAAQILDAAEQGGGLQLSLLRATRNGGFGAGNNVGANFLLTLGFQGYLWLLNNDAEALPDCLERLQQRGRQEGLPPVIGMTLVDHDARERVQACGGQLAGFGLLPSHRFEGEPLAALQARGDTVLADYPVGAAFLVHTDLLRGGELFDERYFLYFEEIALMHRLGQGSVVVSTQAVVAHKGGASTGTHAQASTWNKLADFHSIRSRILYGRQRGGLAALAAVGIGLAIAAKRLLACGAAAGSNALGGVISALKA